MHPLKILLISLMLCFSFLSFTYGANSTCAGFDSVSAKLNERQNKFDAKLANFQLRFDSLESRNSKSTKNNNQNWIQILTLIITTFGFFFTILVFIKNNKIKKSEFILNLYKEFNDKDITVFLNQLDNAFNSGNDLEYFKKMETNKEEFKVVEKGLIKILTFVDELYYFWENKLLKLKEFEYFAYEIVSLSKSKFVDKFISDYYHDILKRKNEYDKSFLKEIFPYTGLKWIVKDGFIDKMNKYCSSFTKS